MKKLLTVLIVVLALNYSFSQEALYGVRVGYNISNLDFEPYPTGIENSHRNGFAIGFFGEYKIAKSVAVAPELQFSAEGAKEKSIRVNYIQMPILLKYQVTDCVAIAIGPKASLKTHSYQDAMQNFAFSGIGGIEYMISDEFFLDFRYSYGLTNIFDDDIALEAKNTNMQIGFGLKF